MSQTKMDPQAAHTLLMQKVWYPTFFAKLAADYGITAKTAEDQRRLLDIASGIAQEKRAQEQAGDPLLKNAHASLFGGNGHVVADDTDIIDDAATKLASDQHFANAVLSLAAAGGKA